MKPKKTWVLVADAARACVFETSGAGGTLAEVPGLAREHDHRASHELGSDRPGRVVESANASRHAVAAKTDPHRALKRTFAVELAELIEAEAAARNIDRLVIVLPPVMLGDFRAAASVALKSRIAAEIGKDLTKATREDIEKHVAAVVPL